MTDRVAVDAARAQTQGVAGSLGEAVSTMLDTHLPLNRKERYYTGTVLPMLIASDGFLHLQRFLNLCGLQGVKIDLEGVGGRPAVQFYTEYSFAESVFSKSDLERFADRPLERDTPDLVIVGQDWLLAVEAKVFHPPTRQALQTQLLRQRALVDYWIRTLGLAPDKVSHVLLVPHGLAQDRPALSGTIVTWEQVAEAYATVAPGYWVDILHVALGRYADLASPEPTFGPNADAVLTGEEIYASQDLEFAWMGRRGGLQGTELGVDLDTGKWRQRTYELRRAPLPGNSNWFAVTEFIAKVGATEQVMHQSGAGVAAPDHAPANEPVTKVSLHAADKHYLDAYLEEGGTVVLRGQDLSRSGEYEYAFTIEAKDVPKLRSALGGQEGEPILALLSQHGSELYQAGESHWLKKHRIPAEFWSRVEQ